MKNKASTPNPYLQPLDILIGEWETIGAHPSLPGTELHGRASFEWIESGAFLKISSTIAHPDFPDGISLCGSDNGKGETCMLYFDERGVSRNYTFRIEGNRWSWWRDDSEFSQRFTVTIENDGKVMAGKGEMRRKNSAWESDLNLTYYRI